MQNDVTADDRLTFRQALAAMELFLDEDNSRLSGEATVLDVLSDINTRVWADGSTADPAAWFEWVEAARKARATAYAEPPTA